MYRLTGKPSGAHGRVFATLGRKHSADIANPQSDGFTVAPNFFLGGRRVIVPAT
jgi:hypothetical protein